MATIRTIFSVFKTRTLLIAVAALILGNLAINYFLLSPGEEMLKNTRVNSEKIKEIYVGLKSADLAAISKTLQEEVEYLNMKQAQISNSILSTEQIPLFISGLERDAEKVGLTVETKIVHQKKKTKSVAINLEYSGTIHQVLKFLNTLAKRNEIIPVQNFRIYNPNSEQNKLNGEMQFISLLEIEQ